MKKLLLLILTSLLIFSVKAQPFGSALWFDDVNDYIVANSVSTALANETEMTLEAWIYPQSHETQDFVLTFYSVGYQNRILFGLKNGILVAVSNNGSGDVNFYGTTPLSLNQWSHIAMTVDISGFLNIYLNGTNEYSGDNFLAMPESGGYFCIGQDFDWPNTTDHFHGLIDEVRIWNIARDLTQIQDTRYSPIASPTSETNLIAYYTFDDTSNGILSDLSGKNNTGTLNFYNKGDGSSGAPYEIASASDLIYLSQHSSDWGKQFKQTTNIDFGSDESAVDWDGNGFADGNETSGFSPIGTAIDPKPRFTGRYDGGNHTISSLFINRPGQDYIALFGATSNASITNVGLIDVDFTGDGLVGGLIGFCGRWSECVVTNCFTTGHIKGNSGMGGLIAYIQSNSQINNCYSTVNVNANTTAGGFAGYLMGTSSVINCYSTGSTYGTYYTGGFIGYNGAIHNGHNTVITNSYWNMETSGQATSEGGMGITTSEMKNQSMFGEANWDFSSGTGTWNIQNGEYLSYPYLQSFIHDIPGTTPQFNPIPGLSFAPVTWTGGTSDNWDIPTNWSPAVVPSIERDVTIPETELTYMPVIHAGTNAAVRNLTNNSTYGINVKMGGKLTIGGNYSAVEGANIKLGQ